MTPKETRQTRAAGDSPLSASSTLEASVLERFLRYTRIWTTSDAHVEATPSTSGQWDLAKLLITELRQLGIKDVRLTDSCYVIARVPASPGYENAPTIGLMAHMDTASDVSGKDVKPLVIQGYTGENITRPGGPDLDPVEDPDLLSRIGHDIVCSDGSTLLGADDKAGVAEIMTALALLLSDPSLLHGPLELYFTPDEETGKGLPDFPLSDATMIACYTLDAGELGEIETECFTAYQADIEFTGKVIHIGYARGKLANAVQMAASYASLLPRSESPESTDAYYGYYCAMEIKGDLEKAYLKVFIRDFDQAGAERRLDALERFGQTVEAQFPGGKVSINPKLLYLNMKRKIDEHPKVLRYLEEAAEAIGIHAHLKPIRGGTDGSRLTELGIPTPNIFTGGHAFHSRGEWVAVSDMAAAVRLIIELVSRWAKDSK